MSARQLPGFEVPPALVLSWVRTSLTAGGPIAQRLVQQLDRFPTATLLAGLDPTGPPAVINDDDHGFDLSIANAQADELLSHCNKAGVRTLITENEMSRRNDPWLQTPTAPEVAFIGDRVIDWVDLADSALTPGPELRGGYPGISYACAVGIQDAGLIANRTLTREQQELIIETAQAIFVSAFDGEGYVALLTPELTSEMTSG